MHPINPGPFRIDLHVHTRRYSPCAELLDPDRLGTIIAERGLDGLVICEHDVMWPWSEIKALNADLNGAVIYRGVEISSIHGHFVVIGLDDLDGVGAGSPVEDIIDKAGPSRAAVILVHHHLNYTRMNRMDPWSLPRGIDAIEVASTTTKGEDEKEAQTIAERRGWHPVAGSDAHYPEQVGAAFTVFETWPADEKDLAAAIKAGLGRPMRGWSGD